MGNEELRRIYEWLPALDDADVAERDLVYALAALVPVGTQ